MQQGGGTGAEIVDVELLTDASKLLTAVVARSLVGAHAAVTTPQLRVLVMLHARDDLYLMAVAHRLGVSASHASRTCEQLVAAELLVREDDPPTAATSASR